MIKDYLKTAPQYLIPKRLLTVLIGLFADCTQVKFKNFFIKHFIHHYQVNMQEALHPDPTSYRTFNDFFIRQLHPLARPMGKATLLCPVDGCIGQIGQIKNGELLQAKGRSYTLQQLIHDAERARVFQQGLYATLYLAPKDYHHIHMPMDGHVRKVIYLPGKLFSVQPATTRVVPRLFSQNERVVIFFDTPIGEMIMVLVGAVIVGKIATSWHGEFKRSNTIQQYDYPAGQLSVKKGDDIGYFKLGSTVILMLAPQGELAWDPQLKENEVVRLHQDLSVSL
ncbi:MAG: archaetidylserine decarboxylase [Gammaproteobacteria bacterium]|nr:archaetidylserine decarboxylase [Gammaproteobacteria bacterium]